jgi:hypothetical protein
VTPVTHFAFQLLNQVAVRGGKSKSRLVLQHMSISLVMHLVKILPHLFNMGIVAKLFDITNSNGRRSMARVMCLLRNVQSRKKNAEEQKPISVDVAG